MQPLWLGLWAAGLLTRSQRAWLVAQGTVDAADAIRALWEDRRRPRTWSRFEGVDVLLGRAKEGFAELERACRAVSPPLRVVVAEDLGLRTGSPYLCLRGETLPPVGVLAVVGTRRIHHEDEASLARWLSPLVLQAHAVVSGGALGVDTVAHQTALDRGVPTWVVFASGLSHVSPKSNCTLFDACLEAGGGWVSENPPWYQPRAHDFLERNEVIAGLSDIILVARAPYRSGALSTARAGRSYGKIILAFPGAPDDPNAAGCHQLIQTGALLATPEMDLRLWLPPTEQMSLLGETQVEEVAALPPVLEAEEEAKLRRFSSWVAQGREGWIDDDAGAHQELVLDLELGGWVSRDLAGDPQWTERGLRVEKAWLVAATKAASC